MADAARLLTPRTLTMCRMSAQGGILRRQEGDRSVANARYIAIGDIGCYTWACIRPLKFMQDVFCMGAVRHCQRRREVRDTDPVIATIGD